MLAMLSPPFDTMYASTKEHISQQVPKRTAVCCKAVVKRSAWGLNPGPQHTQLRRGVSCRRFIMWHPISSNSE